MMSIPIPSFGAEATFNPRVLIGGDTTPPTVPDPVTATPVSTNQIEVSWGMATDNVAVAGYRVFRDMIQIATTTLTTFVDTGLLASTTYTYSIDAFDIFGNFSTSSLPVATTTFSIPEVTLPTPTTTPSSIGSIIMRVHNLEIETVPTRAFFTWQTNVLTRYVLRWGRTSSYELGSIFGGIALSSHQTSITGLEAATKYYYSLEAIHTFGIRREIAKGEFTTSGVIPKEAVPNVSQLVAQSDREAVLLRWINPAVATFGKVRVTRSHLFYPQHPFDGALVYEGGGQSVVDVGALRERSPQYYTVFVYDTDGRVSSGAVAVAMRLPLTTGDDPEVIIPSLGSDDERRSETATTSQLFHSDLLAMDVQLTQGETIAFLHDPTEFSHRQPLLISIPVSALPRHLKSIVVTLTKPGNEIESTAYLLKINPAGTQYEALISPLRTPGKSTVTIRVYDFERATIRTVENNVIFTDATSRSTRGYGSLVVMSGIFLVLVILVGRNYFLVSRRRREDNSSAKKQRKRYSDTDIH